MLTLWRRERSKPRIWGYGDEAYFNALQIRLDGRSTSIDLAGPDSGCASVERVRHFVNSIAEAPADVTV